eukprot:4679360-Amphidinium_carterae.3
MYDVQKPALGWVHDMDAYSPSCLEAHCESSAERRQLRAVPGAQCVRVDWASATACLPLVVWWRAGAEPHQGVAGAENLGCAHRLEEPAVGAVAGLQ